VQCSTVQCSAVLNRVLVVKPSYRDPLLLERCKTVVLLVLLFLSKKRSLLYTSPGQGPAKGPTEARASLAMVDGQAVDGPVPGPWISLPLDQKGKKRTLLPVLPER